MTAAILPLLVFLPLQSEGPKPAEKQETKAVIEEILTAEYLEKRFALLQPALEKALGEPFPAKVRFVPTKIREFTDVLARETAAMKEMQENRKLDEDERDDLAVSLQGQAHLYFAKLDIAEGSIRISLDSFVYLQTLGSPFDCIQEGWFHDILLLHEAVHVWQAKKVDLFKYYGEAKDLPSLLARSAAVEGMAQYYAGKAADILGKRKYFEQFRAVFKIPETGLQRGEGVRAMLELFSRIVGFPYIEGESFFVAIAGSLGEGPAVSRVFALPPATTGEISIPVRYLARK